MCEQANSVLEEYLEMIDGNFVLFLSFQVFKSRCALRIYLRNREISLLRIFKCIIDSFLIFISYKHVKYKRFWKTATKTSVIFFIFLFIFIYLWQRINVCETWKYSNFTWKRTFKKIHEFHVLLNVGLLRGKLESF